MRLIGIFGGSFNPIHTGHISLARQLLRLAKLDEVWFMVSPQNPLKQTSELLDDNLRYNLVRLALHGEEGMRACNFEFKLPRPSYTWNTLQQLCQQYPDDEFTLLIGGDNWSLFPSWYRAEDILRQYHVVVYPRRESPVDASSLPAGVTLVDTPLLDISSTQIRHHIAEGLPIDHLVPKIIAPLVCRCY